MACTHNSNSALTLPNLCLPWVDTPWSVLLCTLRTAILPWHIRTATSKDLCPWTTAIVVEADGIVADGEEVAVLAAVEETEAV